MFQGLNVRVWLSVACYVQAGSTPSDLAQISCHVLFCSFRVRFCCVVGYRLVLLLCLRIRAVVRARFFASVLRVIYCSGHHRERFPSERTNASTGCVGLILSFTRLFVCLVVQMVE